MLEPRIAAVMLSVAPLVLGMNAAVGQDFPNKPMRITTTAAGGGNDFVARLIGLGLSSNLGQSVVIDNRPTGTIATQLVAKTPPDGYNLLVYGSGFWITPFLEKTPYDPIRDFIPITGAVTLPQVLAVHPSLPVKTVKELLALARAKPGALSYASAAVGSSTYLAAELFKSMAGINMLGVPYALTSTARIDVLSGRVEILFATPSGVSSDVKAGRLRALAVTSLRPSALLPDLPTVAASGVPGYQTEQMTGAFAPANTPPAIVNRLNQEIVRVLKQPDVREKFLTAGVEPVGSSSEEFSTYIKSDMSRVSKLIRDAGIKTE